MPNYTKKTAISKIQNAEKHLERIHLPKMVDLNEQSPFNVVLTKCKECEGVADKWETKSGWMVQCDNVLCEGEIQAPVMEEWKAALLWNQLNARVNDYRKFPFFHLEGLVKSRARNKMKHIDNFVRMNMDKAIALDFLEPGERDYTKTLYEADHWIALYTWVLAAKAAINQYKITDE